MLQWYHRDEMKTAAVFAVLILSLSRSSTLTAGLFLFLAAAIAMHNVVRFMLARRKQSAMVDSSSLLLRMEKHLPRFPWDRSRIVYATLSVVIFGALWLHRHMIWVEGGGGSTPTGRYWSIFLAWYSAVWIAVFGYLWYVWRTERRVGRRPHKLFWEGLLGSMFFYHGLPPKARVVTFAAACLLGGVPTFLATQISPDDADGIMKANFLLFPVAILTVGGAFYTMRWIEAFEEKKEGEVEAAAMEKP